MSTYFKYAERDATTNVNWAEISSNMVDTLNEAVKIREDKKAAIDKATNELSSTLADAPQGEHAGLNEFALIIGFITTHFVGVVMSGFIGYSPTRKNTQI